MLPDQQPLGAVTFAENPEPRCPCLLLLDTSGSMAGQAIADSIGAVAGRDRHGPTALMRSVAGIPQQLAPGTLVTNFRFAKSMFNFIVGEEVRS